MKGNERDEGSCDSDEGNVFFVALQLFAQGMLTAGITYTSLCRKAYWSLIRSILALSTKVVCPCLFANCETLVRQLSNACLSSVLQAFDSCQTNKKLYALS